MKLASNKLCNAMLIVCVLAFSPMAFAAADLQFSRGVPETQHSLSSRGVSYVLTNVGDMPSATARFRIWASTDATIDDNDLMSQVFEVGPVNPGQRLEQTLNFRLPTPSGENSDLPPLYDQGVTASMVLGETLFVRACLLGARDLPIATSCDDRQLTIAPIVRLDLQASNGLSAEYIDITWPADLDNGVVLADNFFFLRTQGNLDTTRDVRVALADPDLELVDAPNGGKLYRFRVTGLMPGQQYYFVPLANCLGDNCASFEDGSNFVVGNTLVGSDAVSPNFDQISISWNPYNPIYQRLYQLQRCLANQQESCEVVATALANLNFTDSTASLGVEYVYKVFGCEPDTSSDFDVEVSAADCNNTKYFALSNPITLNPLDRYESDNNVTQAKTVRSSVVQLHSLHVAEDRDWVRLVVTHEQAVKIKTSPARPDLDNRDLDFIVYGPQGQPIEITLSDEDSRTLYAAQTLVLAEGEYFIDFFQPPPTTGRLIDPLFQPLEAYLIEIELENMSPTLAPIHMLLLNEQ